MENMKTVLPQIRWMTQQRLRYKEFWYFKSNVNGEIKLSFSNNVSTEKAWILTRSVSLLRG